jgi:thiol-disulfide isomerase/thioredoxin
MLGKKQTVAVVSGRFNRTSQGTGEMQIRLIAVLALLSLIAEASHSAETQPLTAVQIARGQVIQQLLVRGIDFAREQGNWPQQLAELKIEKLPPVVYVGPPAKLETMDRNVRCRLRAISPVCHERLEQHPDGVWVGFADGHLEFVRDRSALDAALVQPGPDCNLLMMPTAPTPAEKPAQPPDARLVLNITDEGHKPVAGAQVGNFMWNADYEFPRGRAGLTTLMGEKLSAVQTTSDKSDKEGHVEIQYQWFFAAEAPPDTLAPLIVFHKDRGLMGLVQIDSTDFDRKEDGKVQSMAVELRRAVPVQGTLSRITAPLAAGESSFTNVYVYPNWRAPLRPLSSLSKSRQFHFLLPPGDYLLHAYGDNSYNTFRYLKVAADAPTIKLDLDLPADRLTSLVAKPAPELRGIKSWKDGKPTTLAELRGKWVLVDFWGYWCGPCIAAMPDLMKLHDEFGDKGLAIVAVHDGTAETIDELIKNLEAVKKQSWNDRDLPFWVALDGGGEVPISGTERSVKGATHATYGVQSWPTTVLIDPQGNVVGPRDARGPELRKFLAERLNLESK